VAETHALLLTRVGYQAARQFLEEAEQSTITIVRATTRDEERARAIIYQYQDKDFSLTDAISFAVMERLDIRYAFTFDRHFAQYGLPVLTPE
jgi:predicted nucleic acid-binding protein